MFGKTRHMEALESRKRLLIAESELNRAHLIGTADALVSGTRELADRAGVPGLLGVAIATFTGGRRGRAGAETGKPSPLPTILRLVGVVSSLWLACLPVRRA